MRIPINIVAFCVAAYQVYVLGPLSLNSCLQLQKKSNNPFVVIKPWWCHEMETFSALLAKCAGNSPVPGEFPTQRPVTRSFDVSFDLHLNKRLSKQSIFDAIVLIMTSS